MDSWKFNETLLSDKEDSKILKKYGKALKQKI